MSRTCTPRRGRWLRRSVAPVPTSTRSRQGQRPPGSARSTANGSCSGHSATKTRRWCGITPSCGRRRNSPGWHRIQLRGANLRPRHDGRCLRGAGLIDVTRLHDQGGARDVMQPNAKPSPAGQHWHAARTRPCRGYRRLHGDAGSWVQKEQYSALRVPRGLRSAFGFPSTGGYTAIYRQLNPDVIHVITYRGTERSALVQESGAEPAPPRSLERCHGSGGLEADRCRSAGVGGSR